MEITYKKQSILFCIVLFTSCATHHPYDPDNPDEYREYWENNEAMKDTYLYQQSEECEDLEKKGYRCGSY